MYREEYIKEIGEQKKAYKVKKNSIGNFLLWLYANEEYESFRKTIKNIETVEDTYHVAWTYQIPMIIVKHFIHLELVWITL